MIEKYIITPFQKFARIESFSGILLFIATVIALVWANSPFSDSYFSIWQYKLGISTQSFALYKPLILWINDGLMAVFFFLIGLEIKRELLIGELNTVKKAAFPFFAALGGMLVPVLIYLSLNSNPDAGSGWGIPMATDIAFSLAILKMLGKRVPLGLKVFLTAFAIVDDLGAVMVIAIFYSTDIKWYLLAYSLIPLLTLVFMNGRQLYSKYLTVALGVVVWFLFLKAGIHPTVAGVLIALTVPIRQRMDVNTYITKLGDITSKVKESEDKDSHVLTKKQIEEIDNLEDWTDKVQSPLQHLEHKLHNWVAYFIMPVFALSNAGVAFGGNMQLDSSVIAIIAIALVVGNFIGVSTLSFLGVKLKVAEFPAGAKKIQVFGIALLAGVGFTMSIFIANLAFLEQPMLVDSAKIGIIVGSLIAGIGGYLLLRFSGNSTEAA